LVGTEENQRIRTRHLTTTSLDYITKSHSALRPYELARCWQHFAFLGLSREDYRYKIYNIYP